MSLSFLWKSVVGYVIGMEINPINSKININNQQKSEETTSENFVADVVQEQDLPVANPSLLRAYTGIVANKDRQLPVSTEDLLKYLEESNVPRKDKYPDIVSALTDKDGQISQEAFDLFVAYKNKGILPFDIISLFKLSKEDEKLNYDALNVINSLIKNYKKRHFDFIYADIIKEMKDVDGKFDAEFLKLIGQYSEQFSEIFEIRPKVISNVFKNRNGKFSKSTIAYVSDEMSNGTAFRGLINNILKGQNKNGDFSKNLLNVVNDVETNYPREMIFIVDGMIRNSSEDEYQQILDFVNLIKDNQNADKILRTFDSLNIERNEANLDYLTKLFGTMNYNKERVESFIKITNLKPENFDDKLCQIIQTLNFLAYDNEAFELILNSSMEKSDEDKEPVLNVDTLEKYIDIYKNNKVEGSEIIKKLSCCLALEDDDKALNVFHKLFTLSWANKYGGKEKLSTNVLFFLLELLCLEKNGEPTRKCLEERIQALEKLLTLKYPMLSRDTFSNFLMFTEFESIEKLEKLGFHEMGLDPGQTSNNLFKDASEEDLLKLKEFLKDYLKDKNIEKISIDLNPNISTIVEIVNKTDGIYSETVLFDLAKGKPLSETKETKYSDRVYRTQKDFVNNTLSELKYIIRKMGYEKYEVLDRQSFKLLDENGEVCSEELLERSDIENVYNVKKINSKGEEKNIVKAFVDANGNKIVHKDLESFDGTKTIYHYEDDPQGNRILDYKIVDNKGKILLNQSTSFEVLSDNHFMSTRNNKKFDIKIDGTNLVVTDLQAKNVVNIELEEFTNSTQDKLLGILKQFPGDELLAMKSINLKNFVYDNDVPNAAYKPDKKSINVSEKYLDLSVILHELGHAKDSLVFSEINEEIYSDPVLKDIYQKEKEAFRNHFGDEQLSFIGYFSSDKHYLGASNAIREGIAETNSLLSTLPQNDVQAIRSHYWQQYFPRTIAYLSSLLI